MKEQINQNVELIKAELQEISQFIGTNPELGNQEFMAAEVLTNTLKKYGFNVQLGVCDIPTAFEAVYDSGIEGPSIGFMAEYDALPEIGHGCGHNLIGTMSVGAAIALNKVMNKCGGKLYVYGTPAEETEGAKIIMAEQGVFNHLDVALMIHPADCYQKSGTSLAMDPLQFEFFGKPAHAAAKPHEGINALDAVIQTFNGINALRQHVTPDVRIHGIIAKGGEAPNIIPDYAVGQFYVRAQHRNYLDTVVEKVKNCASAAALATGATLKTSIYQLSYDDLITNETLSKTFTNNLIELGVNPNEIKEKDKGTGSTDMGNVSHIVPSIHPYIKISDEPCVSHTKEFQKAAVSEKGMEALILGSKCLANTAFDIIVNQDLLKTIKEEFNKNK